VSTDTQDTSAAPAATAAPAPAAKPGKTFEDLFTELAAKVAAGTPGSRTVELVQAGVHTIGKKIVEEASEVWMAAEYQGNEHTAEEISQLLYHLQVLMVERGITLDDVYSYL
jgi:phosphoribosyl-ATP pyrophosphohydrolase